MLSVTGSLSVYFTCDCSRRERIQFMVLKNDIDPHLQEELLELALTLEQHPELAYEEEFTVSQWTCFSKRHKLPITYGLHGKAPMISLGEFDRARCKIVMTADLDAVKLSENGPVGHFCGHHAQSIHALGLAAMLLENEFDFKDLAIRMIGCPAEECRPAYDSNCALPFIPGKKRLLEEGWFDGATAVLSTHLDDDVTAHQVHLSKGTHGAIWLRAHWMTDVLTSFGSMYPISSRSDTLLAAYRKELGLYIHAVKTQDKQRYLDIWIETNGQNDQLTKMSIIRLQQITVQCLQVNVELVTHYEPLRQEKKLLEQAKYVLRTWDQSVTVKETDCLQGATDLGEVSALFPTLQIFVGGTKGMTHEHSFRVVDPLFSYIWPIIFVQKLIFNLLQ